MGKIKFILSSILDVITLLFYKIYFKIIRKSKTNTWLIAERGIDARDNGYFFYKYLKENHSEINVKYVINKESADYHKIDPKDVVLYRSKEHYYYFLYSKYLIGASIMGFSPNERLYYRLNKYGLLKLNGKNVFLQHGITKDFMPYMLPEYTKLDLFICAAKPEHKYLLNKYGYKKNVAVLTGLSRFDSLENKAEKIILVMPTWRKWLKYNDSLIDTEYYKNYMELLNDKEIIDLLEKNNFKLMFYPHIMLQKFLKEFKVKSNSIILASFEKYDVQDLLKRASLLITDYSSVYFDFAYMKKHVIYYQFDLEKYRNEQYFDGYFDYEKDGFGPVCYDLNRVKEYLKDYFSGKNKLNDFKERINNFFDEPDNKNNERIFEQIRKL